MDWKTMLAYITGSVDEDLLLRNEYLAAENRILRGQVERGFSKRPLIPLTLPDLRCEDPSFLPISASVFRSPSVSFNRPSTPEVVDLMSCADYYCHHSEGPDIHDTGQE